MLKIFLLVLLLMLTSCFDETQQTEKTADNQGGTQPNQPVKGAADKLLLFEKYVFSKVIIDNSTSVLSAHSDCSMVLQFVASNSEGVDLIQAHIKSLKTDKRLENLPICINQPVWFKQSGISCSNNPNQRLKCDIKPLIKLAEKREFTHAIVVSKSGKANVHNGIMYLDYNDSYSVFVHELAHFAGFVDEYPLSDELAKNICQVQTHPNIVVVEPTNRRLDGLVAVRTCDNHVNQAFKLVQKMTFMEYHDVGLIPQQYLDIWRQRLISVEKLTPAYVNFAQYYEDKGDTANANKWWHDYQQYL